MSHSDAGRQSRKRPDRARKGPLLSLLPALFGLAAVIALGAVIYEAGAWQRPTPRRESSPWRPVAQGKLCYWNVSDSFRLLVQWGERSLVRVEEEALSFEGPDMEVVLQAFLRAKLVALQPGDPFGLELYRTEGRERPARAVVSWGLLLRETRQEGTHQGDPHQGATAWYSALEAPARCAPAVGAAESDPPGADAAAIVSARTTEDLKNRLSGLLAAELVRELSGS